MVTVPRDLVSIRDPVPIVVGIALCQSESYPILPSMVCQPVFLLQFCYFIWQMNPSSMALGEKETTPIYLFGFPPVQKETDKNQQLHIFNAVCWFIERKFVL